MTDTPPTSTRDLILHEATTLFLERGYHGISMREIAARVGVSKASLYYHFRDKEQLFLAILHANIDLITNIVDRARQEPTTRQQIRRMLFDLAQQAPRQHAMIRLASQEIGNLSPAARQTFVQHYHSHFIHTITAMLQAGIDAGELKVMDARQATWLLLGMMYPFLYPRHADAAGSLSDAVALIADIFFDGAAAPPAVDEAGEETA